jgi:hypothetical protein
LFKQNICFIGKKKKRSSYAYETLVTQILINVVVNNSNNISFTVKLWLIYLQEKVS